MGLRGPDGSLYACIRRLDLASGRVVRQGRLTASHPPPDGDQAALPHLDGTWLWQPTRTALHRVDPESLRSEQVLTHPLFHDVHSVSPGRHGWLVTCTGHETVVDIALDGTIGQRWSLGPAIDPDRDFRGAPHDARKPHAVHPNHAFLHAGRAWVTCLSEGACRGLDHPGCWHLGPGLVHDGVLREGLRWFTTTDGRIRGVDPESGAWRVDLDVAALEGASGAFGWCRGIEVHGDRLWVGITVLRRSRWRELARQAVGARREPTRVLAVDWRRRRIVDRWEVGDRGEGVIYGVTGLTG